MEWDNETSIHAELAHLVVERGVLPPMPGLKNFDLSWEEVLSSVISAHCKNWDQLAAHIRRTSAPIYEESQMLEWFLRLLVVDSSFRMGSAMVLRGYKPPTESVPSWARARSRGYCLREIQQEIGPRAPSLEKLAEMADVSPNALKEWRAGSSRPYDRNITTLASALAPFHPTSSEDDLAGRLRRHYFLSDLCTFLCGQIGSEKVEAMTETLMRLAARIMTKVTPSTLPADSHHIGVTIEMLLNGSRNEHSLVIARELAKEEPDPEWQEAILASTTNTGWLTYMQDKAYRTAADIGNRQPLKHDGDGPSDFREYEHEMIERTTNLRNSLASGDHEAARTFIHAAIADLRSRVTGSRESAEYHYALGSRLGVYGCLLNETGWIEEGIFECKIASVLDPSWEAPLLEVGIIRMKQGNFDQARTELEAAIASYGETSAGLAFNLAQARMFCGEFLGAIGLFETVIKGVPDFAEAIDCLAFCYLRSGDSRRGSHLAQKARHLGSSWTYDHLQSIGAG